MIEFPYDVTRWSANARRKGHEVGFVPTMGALHEGHLELVSRAIQECGSVVCSIFVNPLQFNDLKDLERYPRQLAKDRELLQGIGCHALFIPEQNDLFAGLKARNRDLGGLDRLWEGASRPGHFQGVANVVERLFHYVRPDRAYFGEKDRQQLLIIRHVARTEGWPVAIVSCPTKRASDGLALSSRNRLLGPEDRIKANVLFRSLEAASELAFKASVRETCEAALAILGSEPEVRLDHFVIVDAGSLEPLKDWNGSDTAIALVAANIGLVRLIDNLTLTR